MSVRAMKWAYGLFEVIDIPPAERLVLLALCWDHTEQGGCFPSRKRISLMAGYRARKIDECLNCLEAMGFIKRSTTRKGGKFQETNYTLFGAPKARPSADGGARNRAQTGANGEGDHRQTGADGAMRRRGRTVDAPTVRTKKRTVKGSHRAQTGAQYRGYTNGDVSSAKIVAFPSQELSSSSGLTSDPSYLPLTEAEISKPALSAGKGGKDV